MAQNKQAFAAFALAVPVMIAVALDLSLRPSPLSATAERLLTMTQSGTFVDSGQLLSEAATWVALGDLDGDADADALLATSAGSVVWSNDGAGVFTATGQTLGSAYASALELGDLDGDGDLDVFVVEDTAKSNRVWLNQGGGQGGDQGVFAASGQAFGDDLPGGVALGDLDGDGDLDAFVTRNVGRPNQVWLNDGSGSFVDSGQRLGAASSGGVALGDLDGDGDLDAFVADTAANSVWINQGGAQGAMAGAYVDSGQALGDTLSIGVALGDIDRDGDLDAVTASVNSGLHLWVNQGGKQAGLAGTFAAGGILGASGNRHVTLVDVDGDGDRDLFAARAGANTVWLNQGGIQPGIAGTFVDSGQQMANLFSSAAALADLDGDNDVDAVVANASAAGQVWRNEGVSGVQAAYQIRDGVLAGTPRGQHYIELFYAHNPEILSLILADRARFDAGYDTLMQWMPALQTLVDGSGGGAVITQAQVDALDAFLGGLEETGSTALRQAIADERTALPALDSFVGQTMAEARSDILGDAASFPIYLPLVRTTGATSLNQIQPHQDGSTQAMGGCFMACWLGTSECQ